jgi:hypothetical protein
MSNTNTTTKSRSSKAGNRFNAFQTRLDRLAPIVGEPNLVVKSQRDSRFVILRLDNVRNSIFPNEKCLFFLGKFPLGKEFANGDEIYFQRGLFLSLSELTELYGMLTLPAMWKVMLDDAIENETRLRPCHVMRHSLYVSIYTPIIKGEEEDAVGIPFSHYGHGSTSHPSLSSVGSGPDSFGPGAGGSRPNRKR